MAINNKWLGIIAIFLLINSNQIIEAREKITTYSFYDTLIKFNFPDNSIYNAGKTIDYSFELINAEGYVIQTPVIVILLTNCELSADGIKSCKIVKEKQIHLDSIDRGKYTYNVSFKLPEDLNDGVYFMENYIYTERIQLSGNFESYKPAKNTVFLIEVKNGENKLCAYISKENTHIAGAFEQSGPVVNQNTNVPGAMEIKNNCLEKFTGTLETFLCRYSDTNNCTRVNQYPISINSSSSLWISTSIPTFTEPDAYVIKYVLKDDNNLVNSIYKNRIIIDGEYTPIIDLTINKLNYLKGDNIKFRIGLTGPYYPIKNSAKNIEVKLTFSDLDDKKTLYNNSYYLEELEVDDIAVKEFNFSAPFDLEEYQLCAEIYINNQKSDQKCIFHEKKEISFLEPIEPEPQGEKTNYFLYLTGILIIVITLFLITKKYKKKNLLLICLVFSGFFINPVIYAESCDKVHMTYNYKGEDITAKILTDFVDAEGNKYLPLNTTIKSKGVCVSHYHWCGNTAYTTIRTPHKFTILREGELTITEILHYDLTNLNKAILAEAINNHIYKNGFFIEKKLLPVIESDIPSDFKNNYPFLENALINIIPQNALKRIENTNCSGCSASCGAGANYTKISDAWGYITDKKCKKDAEESYSMHTNIYHFEFEKIFESLIINNYVGLSITLEKEILGCEKNCIIVEDAVEYTLTEAGVYQLFGSDTTLIVENDSKLSSDTNTSNVGWFDSIINYIKKIFF
ncbi:MAG: hypothetical protein KAT28_03205 [Candidatus Aenigmarchaeota archaeon]|nr:hypothetical protein [Candidatus Aenigmarchaeota archaeon]